MDREMLAAALGRFPEKVPLRSSTLESMDCGSYRREKVEYYAEPCRFFKIMINLD